MKQSKFFEVYERIIMGRTQILTKNLVPGRRVYDEDLIRDGKDEFRTWDPFKSKLAAFIMSGAQQIGLRPGNVVLYLGAASGTTPSHVSDIVGKEGFVFALDFAPRVLRDLYFLCKERLNMGPMLENAISPETYADKLKGVDIDFIFQDIAQKSQAEIFLKNCDLFLKKGGFGMVAIKARSIDVTRKPREIFKEIRVKLEKEMTIVDYKEIGNFEKDHAVFVVKKR